MISNSSFDFFYVSMFSKVSILILFKIKCTQLGAFSFSMFQLTVIIHTLNHRTISNQDLYIQFRQKFVKTILQLYLPYITESFKMSWSSLFNGHRVSSFYSKQSVSIRKSTTHLLLRKKTYLQYFSLDFLRLKFTRSMKINSERI